MIYFLRYFAEFRALESQLQESASARIAAEDRVREYRAKCESAEARWEAERDRNDYLSKAVMDHQAIAAGQLPIFNVVPVPQSSEESGELRGTPQRMSARDIQNTRNAKARADAFKRYQNSLSPAEAESN